jgi:hypothetical protein
MPLPVSLVDVPIPLALGASVHAHTLIDCIGEDSQGLVYRATEADTGRLVVLREFFPVGRVWRDGTSVVPLPEAQADFRRELADFIVRVSQVSCIGRPAWWRVEDYWLHGGTAWVKMPWVEGGGTLYGAQGLPDAEALVVLTRQAVAEESLPPEEGPEPVESAAPEAVVMPAVTVRAPVSAPVRRVGLRWAVAGFAALLLGVVAILGKPGHPPADVAVITTAPDQITPTVAFPVSQPPVRPSASAPIAAQLDSPPPQHRQTVRRAPRVAAAHLPRDPAAGATRPPAPSDACLDALTRRSLDPAGRADTDATFSTTCR